MVFVLIFDPIFKKDSDCKILNRNVGFRALTKQKKRNYNFLGIFLTSEANFLPISKPLSKSSSVAPP